MFQNVRTDRHNSLGEIGRGDGSAAARSAANFNRVQQLLRGSQNVERVVETKYPSAKIQQMEADCQTGINEQCDNLSREWEAKSEWMEKINSLNARSLEMAAAAVEQVAQLPRKTEEEAKQFYEARERMQADCASGQWEVRRRLALDRGGGEEGLDGDAACAGGGAGAELGRGSGNVDPQNGGRLRGGCRPGVRRPSSRGRGQADMAQRPGRAVAGRGCFDHVPSRLRCGAGTNSADADPRVPNDVRAYSAKSHRAAAVDAGAESHGGDPPRAAAVDAGAESHGGDPHRAAAVDAGAESHGGGHT